MATQQEQKPLDLEALFENCSDKNRILIVPHVNPDPDALAAAAAWEYIVKKILKRSAKILVSGIIGRAENKMLVRECGIEFAEFEKFTIKDTDVVILIDSQPTHGNNPLPKGRMPDVVVDHHPERSAKTRQVAFPDVRPKYGSSSTIMTEYLLDLELPFPKKLATALLYGLKTDTSNLSRSTHKVDLDMYHELLEHADTKIIAKIERPPLPLDYYKQIYKAFQRVMVYDDVLVVNLHTITTPDYVPLVADFFLTYEEAEWVLVIGRFDGTLVLSLRNKRSRKDAGEIIKDIIKTRGEGGGHRTHSGGVVDLPEKTDKYAEKVTRELISRFLEKIIGKVIVGEPLLQSEGE